MKVLGIETSCDETAAAVVEDGRTILSNVIHSQVEAHRPYGGVVPELASREHLVRIRPIVDQALADARLRIADIDAIAATSGPGLIGSLLVGLTYAKAVAFALSKPFTAVNHIEGHIYSVFFEHPDVEFPALALVVSGGHTNLFWVESETGDARHLKYALVARTRDDAAGEAYDKVGRLLGLPYPGGPVIDRLAKLGNPQAIEFSMPRFSDHSIDFSFSGLKTAVLRLVKEEKLEPKGVEETKADSRRLDILASFQEAVATSLAANTFRAVSLYHPRSVLLSGGVAANSRLREVLGRHAERAGIRLHYPRPILTTDNAAMIAAAGWAHLTRGETSSMTADADPNLRLAKFDPNFDSRRWR